MEVESLVPHGVVTRVAGVVHESDSDRLYLEMDGRTFDIAGADVAVPAPADGVFVFVFERGGTKLVSKVRPPEPFEIASPTVGTAWSLAKDTSVEIQWSTAAAEGTSVVPFLDALCANVSTNIVGTPAAPDAPEAVPEGAEGLR